MEQFQQLIEWVDWGRDNVWLLGLFPAGMILWVLLVEWRIQKAFWPGDDE